MSLRHVEGIKLQHHVFLILALYGSEWVNLGCFKCHVFLGHCSKKLKIKIVKPICM